MKTKEQKNAKETALPESNRSGKAKNIGRRSSRRHLPDPGMQEVLDNIITVLQLGEKGARSHERSSVRQIRRQKTSRQNKRIPRGNQTPEKCNSGNIIVKHGAKKKALNIIKYKHLSRKEKQCILYYINWLKYYSEFSLKDILKGIGINRNKYNYIKKSLSQGQVIKLKKKPVRYQKPMPEEELLVLAYVRKNPGYGYKRYSYMMLDQNISSLKEYQVYEILKSNSMLMFGRHAVYNYTRPPKPKKPDQVWHIDIMYLWIYNRWYYLVDIIDGYSRYLVCWRLFNNMRAETVVETMQEALDKISKKGIKPQIVHDNGKQFIGQQWAAMLDHNKEVVDIKIRVNHPQSNGKIERLHRTHRAECFNHDLDTYGKAVDLMEKWADEYNNIRPHSALSYMTPYDFYYGDPLKKAADRIKKMELAAMKRKKFWLNYNYNHRLAI